MKNKVNRGNIMRHLIEYQLDMVGKRLIKFNTNKAKDCLAWFHQQFGLRIKD